MIRDRLTIAFQHRIGHRLMSQLTRRSFVWCTDTANNRRNAEVIWATSLDEQPLTLCEEMSASLAEQLDQRLASALEHHPQVASVEVLGFGDERAATRVAALHRFGPTSEAFVYAREAQT